MKTTVHDRPVSFRASSALVKAATGEAHAAGMSLTEVLRASLRAAAQGNLNPQGERK